MRHTLDSFFEPVAVKTFLSTIYGRRAHHFTGGDRRPVEIVGWNEFAAIVARNWHDPSRLRLSQEGSVIPVDRYSSQATGFRRLDSPALFDVLRGGATVVIDDAVTVCPEILPIVLSAERVLHERVDSQIFLSGGTTPGFSPHWDPYDVIVLQLQGSKSWKIYEPTRKSPLMRDTLEAEFDPATFVEEVEMRPGDALYVPRGWWHFVAPLGGPSAHITLPIRRRTGADFLLWLSDELRAEELVRADLPQFFDNGSVEEYVRELCDLVANRINERGLAEYLERQDALAPSRTWISLPWVFAPPTVATVGDYSLFMLSARSVIVNDTADRFDLLVDGRRFVLPQRLRRLIEILRDGESRGFATLAEASALPREELHRVLSDLVEQGVVGAIGSNTPTETG